MDALKHNTDTRQRLIEAAGQIFAEQGFRSATVREICQLAEANVAAINYHFGDKERLYSEVVRYTHAFALQRYPYCSPELKGAPAEVRLEYFVTAFINRLFDPGRPAWHGRLMAREMNEPTAALDALVEASVRPQFDVLNQIVGELLPPEADREDVVLCARSVLGQCLFYYFVRPVIERLDGQLPTDSDRVRQLSQHITSFSLTALRGWRKGPEVQSSPS